MYRMPMLTTAAACVAVAGGNVDKNEGEDKAGGKRKGPSAAMPVQDFLEKGVGGEAALTDVMGQCQAAACLAPLRHGGAGRCGG